MKEQTLFEKLKKYGDGDTYPYHMPGHKRKSLTGPLETIADIDITEIYDFDNLSDPVGILKAAQDSLAKYLGVQKSYYLVNGSTVGILAAISAAVPKGGKLLLARNAHKSTYNACCIRDIEPEYIYPYIIEGMNIFEAVTPEQVAKALAANCVAAVEGKISEGETSRDEISEGDDFEGENSECANVESKIDAVIIVSPTYEGRIADIRAIADITHSYGIPLIVDEAHGAHLGFADGVDGYTQSACKLGADIVIQSLHKTIPSPTQTAVLHVNSELIDIDAIEKYLHVYQTSSPSYVLMAAMEASINYMKEFGQERLVYLRDRFTALVDDINSTCIYIEALPFESGVQDPGKFIFSAKKAGLTGKNLTDILRDDYHLEFEMSVREYALAMFTVADEEDAYDRLKNALIDIENKLQNGAINIEDSLLINNVTKVSEKLNKAVYPMSIAWEMNGELIELDKAAGHCANTFIGLYPPGTPILVPGERITVQHVEELLNFIECGYEVTGIVDGKIKILK